MFVFIADLHSVQRVLWFVVGGRHFRYDREKSQGNMHVGINNGMN